MRANFYDENPPDDWEECGCCGGYHPPGPAFPVTVEELHTMECRNDLLRWPSEACIEELKNGTK